MVVMIKREFPFAGGFLNLLTFTGLSALHAAAFSDADVIAEELIRAGKKLAVIAMIALLHRLSESEVLFIDPYIHCQKIRYHH